MTHPEPNGEMRRKRPGTTARIARRPAAAGREGPAGEAAHRGPNGSREVRAGGWAPELTSLRRSTLARVKRALDAFDSDLCDATDGCSTEVNRRTLWDTAMYTLTIVLRALPGHGEALLAACLEAVAPSRREAGCLFFDVLVSEADPEEIVFYEAYVDEAAFDAHMAAPHTKEWQARTLPIIDRARLRFPAHRGVARAP